MSSCCRRGRARSAPPRRCCSRYCCCSRPSPTRPSGRPAIDRARSPPPPPPGRERDVAVCVVGECLAGGCALQSALLVCSLAWHTRARVCACVRACVRAGAGRVTAEREGGRSRDGGGPAPVRARDPRGAAGCRPRTTSQVRRAAAAAASRVPGWRRVSAGSRLRGRSQNPSVRARVVVAVAGIGTPSPRRSDRVQPHEEGHRAELRSPVRANAAARAPSARPPRFAYRGRASDSLRRRSSGTASAGCTGES